MLAVASPWFIARELSSPGFLNYFFIQENLLRYSSSNIGDRYGNVHVFFRGVSLAWWAVAAVPLFISVVCAWRASRRLRSGEESPGFTAGTRVYGSPFPEIVAASIAIALVLSPSRNVLITYLLPAAPIAALAAGHVWTRAQLRLESLGTLALVFAVFYGGAIFAVEGRISEVKSSRDAIALARTVCRERGSTEIVFPRKTPWSAYYYGGSAVVPRAADRYFFRIFETMEEHPDAVYIFKRRGLRRLRDSTSGLLEKFEFVGETGQWHLAVRRPESG